MSRWRFFAGLALAIVAVWSHAAAQDDSIGALSGTLKKIKETRTITLGYRESSLPFSYLNKRAQPIGYSLDLCREVVEQASTELDGMNIKIVLAPVTSADRFAKVKTGDVDLECGCLFESARRRFSLRAPPAFASRLLRCVSTFQLLPFHPSPRSFEPSEPPQRLPFRHGPQAAVGHSHGCRSHPSS
jgi:ABC-type amino acid transport substrate-binding protein